MKNKLVNYFNKLNPFLSRQHRFLSSHSISTAHFNYIRQVLGFIASTFTLSMFINLFDNFDFILGVVMKGIPRHISSTSYHFRTSTAFSTIAI